MSDDHRRLRVGDRIRILAVPGQGVPGFYMHEETRQLFERLVAERTVLCVYEIDEWGTPWVECPCPGEAEEECAEFLGINEHDVWELVTG